MGRTIYVGVDLGKSFHQVAAVDEQKELVVPAFQVERGSRGIAEILQRLRFLTRSAVDLVFTIEATGNYWNELVWELSERGSLVYLAHPKKAHDLRKFYALHTKTDVTDAEALARMPLVDERLRSVWQPTPAQYSLLRLCRLRWKGRCRIADLKRRISTLAEMVVPGIDRVMPVRYSKSARLFLRRYLAPAKARRVGKKRLGQILARAAWGKFKAAKLEQLWQCVQNAPQLGLQADDLLLEVGVQLDELEALERQVARLDERIAELYSEVDPQHRLLKIAGLGDFLAAGITAVVGNVRRFDNHKSLISYAGLAPRVKSSAGSTKAGQGITKHGSPFLRAWAFVAAENARQYDPELRAYYQRLRKRGKHYLVAVCATAARLLERVYDVLMEGVVEETESQSQSFGTG
jgi:transposase